MAIRHPRAISAFVLLVSLAMLAGDAPTPPESATTQPDDPTRVELELRGHVFKLELAATPVSWSRGLSDREAIDTDGGMLFVYPSSRRLNFWMRYCQTDIDVIFVDARGRVTARYAMPREAPRGARESEERYEARLPRYSSRFPVQFAIELAPGWLEELDIQVGERLDLDFNAFRRLAREHRTRRAAPSRPRR
ncbi:MAG: DUF192 domain-containing protein [Planctomycetota bacterium]